MPDQLDPNSPKYLGYQNSLGSQSLIDVVNNWPEKEYWDTTLINLCTMVRNNIQVKDKPDQDVVNTTIQDLNNLLINIYYTLKRTDSDSPYVLLYFPDYSALPPIFRRNLSPMELRVDSLVTKLKSTIQDKYHGDIDMVFDMPVYSMLQGNIRELPYRQIYRSVNDINKKLKSTKKILTRRYLLISHLPLDFYLFSMFRSVRLLESFTGRIRDSKTLGNKTFKCDNVPFNIYTHALFGDQYRVKPIVTRSKKLKFIDIASKTNWMIKSPTEIKNIVTSYDQPLGLLLNQVKF